MACKKGCSNHDAALYAGTGCRANTQCAAQRLLQQLHEAIYFMKQADAVLPKALRQNR
jgi:hypothetical protein